MRKRISPPAGSSRRDFLKSSAVGLAAAALAPGTLAGTTSVADAATRGVADSGHPIVLRTQGSFMVGGTVITAPNGDTFHGDHAYVQYQIPPNARDLPLVLWHGGGQFSKTWESTPDGRDGYQTMFLRRGWAVYNLDQPRRGRAGRGTVGTTISPVPGPGATGEQGIFVRFRIGLWPNYFPGVQFSRDPAALDQWWRQQTPDTGPGSNALLADAVAALFAKIGPG